MKRRLTIEVDGSLFRWLQGSHGAPSYPVDRLLGAARAAALDAPGAAEMCPTCEGVGCERCFTSGRRHLCKVVIAPTTAGRATIDIWQGAPGTMQLVATTVKDRDIASDTIDALLACLRDGGLIVDDKR